MQTITSRSGREVDIARSVVEEVPGDEEQADAAEGRLRTPGSRGLGEELGLFEHGRWSGRKDLAMDMDEAVRRR